MKVDDYPDGILTTVRHITGTKKGLRFIIELNPCTAVKPLAKEEPRERKLDEEEIKTLWDALDSPTLVMSPEIRRALKLILVTAQRPGEVAGMHSGEIRDEWWTIPSSRTKNHREHRVYLTPTARELIGKKKGYIFPSPRPKIVDEKEIEVPIDEKSLACALRRNVKGQAYLKKRTATKRGPYKKKVAATPPEKNRIGIEPFTPHDLRRTATTLMAKAKVLREYRERVLNHTLEKLDATYNQHDYDEVKQAALETLERKLLAIVTGECKDNVVPITAGRKSSIMAKRSLFISMV